MKKYIYCIQHIKVLTNSQSVPRFLFNKGAHFADASTITKNSQCLIYISYKNEYNTSIDLLLFKISINVVFSEIRTVYVHFPST